MTESVQFNFKLITSNSDIMVHARVLVKIIPVQIILRMSTSKIITVWENNSNIALFVLAVIFRLENKPLIWLLHEVISGARILNLLIQHHRDFFYKNNNFINLHKFGRLMTYANRCLSYFDLSGQMLSYNLLRVENKYVT